MLLEHGTQAQSPVVGTAWAWKVSLTKINRIKCPQIMSMVKFSPTALNIGYDFVLSIIFLGNPAVPLHRIGHYASCRRYKAPSSPLQVAFMTKMTGLLGLTWK